MDKLNSFICRVLFVVAFVLAGLAILEKVFNVLGYTLLRSYSPGRLVEFAAVILLFVIALLLRDVRHLLAPKA